MKLSRKAGETLYLYQCHAQDQQPFEFVPQSDGMSSIFITPAGNAWKPAVTISSRTTAMVAAPRSFA